MHSYSYECIRTNMDDEAISLSPTILEIASPRWARNDR